MSGSLKNTIKLHIDNLISGQNADYYAGKNLSPDKDIPNFKTRALQFISGFLFINRETVGKIFNKTNEPGHQMLITVLANNPYVEKPLQGALNSRFGKNTFDLSALTPSSATHTKLTDDEIGGTNTNLKSKKPTGGKPTAEDGLHSFHNAGLQYS